MPDVWATFGSLDPATQARLADVLEVRGADPQQAAMRRAFLGEITFPPGARVVEVGCGTGVLTRMLGRWPGVASVVGVDSAVSLIERARMLGADIPSVTFEEADARSLPFGDATCDVVVFDSVVSHVSTPERALAEAFRLLRPSGVLAIFDGDYATTTVALGENDPLQVCVDAMLAGSVHDRWVMRRLPALVRTLGFEPVAARSHGFVETERAGYMLTIVERGADMLCASRRIGEAAAAALKAEARRRIDAGAFFGHIAYASLLARKAA
jgi:ubiquinone/menaquinone biosynthesis C-methylase UbiE